MTIDEAIKERQKVIEVQEKLYEEASTNESKEIIKSAIDNDRQLVEWLQELRIYRKLRICGNCKHYVYGTTHFGECHATSDIEPCVVGIDQGACDTFFDYKDIKILEMEWRSHRLVDRRN